MNIILFLSKIKLEQNSISLPKYPRLFFTTKSYSIAQKMNEKIIY